MVYEFYDLMYVTGFINCYKLTITLMLHNYLHPVVAQGNCAIIPLNPNTLTATGGALPNGTKVSLLLNTVQRV